MSKSATIILSSPRRGSNSSALAMSVAAGLNDNGVKTEAVDLSGLDIKSCLACEACQRNGGKCAQVDGMQTVYPKVVSADILILASPIYWFNMCGQLKIFLDRCFAIAGSAEGPFSQKTIAATLVYGDVDPFVSGAVNAIRTFQDICGYTGAQWGGVVYGSAMERDTLVKNEELLAQAKEMGRKLAAG